jgi:hypothetical protein
LIDPSRPYDTTPTHLVPVSTFIWYSIRLVPIFLRSSGTNVVFIRYLFLCSSGTYLCASLVPIYLTVCIWYQSSCSSCARLVLVPHLQAWVFERIFFRWVQGVCWLEHPLFIEDHDTLHPHALHVMRMKSFP